MRVGPRASLGQDRARSLPMPFGGEHIEPRAWSRLRELSGVGLLSAESDRAVADRQWPGVTLVMPSFNQERFLEDAILSVVNQRYPDLEFILMDGGSTDGSKDIILRYAQYFAYWESSPDQGQANAINKGWKRGSGRYYGWLNSDDQLTPGSLACAVTTLEAHPGDDMVYGDVIRINENGEWLGVHRYPDFDTQKTIIRGDDIAQAGSLVRRSVLDRTGFLDEGLHYLMDKDLWLRIALAGGSIRHIRMPLAIFRVYDEAKTQAGDAAAVEERYSINRRLFASPQLSDQIRRRQSSITAKMHATCARTHMKGGRYDACLREAGRAVMVDPFQLAHPSLWRTIMLGVLGLVIGESGWRRLRSWFRKVRLAGPRPSAGGE